MARWEVEAERCASPSELVCVARFSCPSSYNLRLAPALGAGEAAGDRSVGGPPLLCTKLVHWWLLLCVCCCLWFCCRWSERYNTASCTTSCRTLLARLQQYF